MWVHDLVDLGQSASSAVSAEARGFRWGCILFQTTRDAEAYGHVTALNRTWFGRAFMDSIPLAGCGLTLRMLAVLLDRGEGPGRQHPSVAARRGCRRAGRLLRRLPRRRALTGGPSHGRGTCGNAVSSPRGDPSDPGHHRETDLFGLPTTTRSLATSTALRLGPSPTRICRGVGR